MDITAWLAGMLAIASAIMVWGLWPVMLAEMRSTDRTLRENRALRLSAGLFIHGIGAIVLFGSVITPVELALAAYLVWFALGCWLVAKVLIISTGPRLRVALVLFAAWSAACALWAIAARGAVL